MAQPRYVRTTDETDHRTGKRIVIGLLVLLILGLGSAWAMGWFTSTDRAVAAVRQLQDKLADPATKDAERRVLWREMREKMDALAPEAREQAWEAGRERFEQRMNDHIKEVLAMSKADQTKALDADIDRIQRFEQMRQSRDTNSATGSPQASGSNNNRQNNNRANRQRTGYRSDSDRITQQKNRLDRSTPQVRAMRLQYRQLLDQRMQQRGLPPMQRRWG